VSEPTEDLDPFDLPEWLGDRNVAWRPDEGLGEGFLVPGSVSSEAGDELACDLLAVDEAYPTPVADDRVRTRAHQFWQHGQVLLVRRTGRLTLAVPGRSFTADLALESLARLAAAVGASPERYAALLRVGVDHRRGDGAGG
jgi:hypothetical protein